MAKILVPQCVVARNVGLGLALQDQGLRGIDPWRSCVLAVDQAVQNIEPTFPRLEWKNLAISVV